MPEATTRRAADSLGCSERHVRRLIHENRLATTGKGQARRITWASIEEYRGKRNVDIYQDMSLRGNGDLAQDQIIMQKLIQSLPALSRPRSAARRLGVAPAEFNKLLDAGHVPCVHIGPSRFVGRRWLAETLAKANGFPPELRQ